MIEENIFPRWEHNIPTLGTKHSHAGNKTGLRLAVTLLLLMVVGVSGVKADDYSGIYYLANNNADNYQGYNHADNFYLCPSSEYYNTSGIDSNNGKPFLTTKKTGHAANALWIVEKVTDTEYYTFKQKDGDSYRYLTVNDQFSSGSTTYAANRRRVHLEPLSSTELTNRNYFTITYIHSKLGINGYSIGCVDDYKNGNNQYLNPAKGNFDQYNHYTSDPSAGIIGFFTQGTSSGDGRGSVWFFESPKPEISYSANNKITITPDANVTTFYTTDGSSPIDSSTKTECSGTQEETMTDVTIVKTVASAGGVYSQVSTSVWLPISIDNQYLIQNLERTDFYMIPGDVSGENTTVNTTSLFRPTMSWYFSDAGSVGGVQYYYIINGHTGDYLYHTIVTIGKECAVYMKTSSVFDAATDKTGYMFSIVQGYSDAEKNNPDGFHIVPKSQISANEYSIYKGGWSSTTPIANASADAMKGSTNGRQPGHKHTRWKFVLPSTLDKTPPFTVTDASTHITKFYKIASVGSSGYYIVPPTGNNTNATTSNSADAAVVKSGTWYFEKAQDATDADWCTYYYIRNAETGKYLYFTKDGTDYATNPKACLEMRETKSGDEDPYLFTWARTAEENVNYYIVPKKLKDVSLNIIGTLQRSGNTLQSDLRRDAGNYAWTFEDAVLFCSNPIFKESGDNIVISCVLGSAEIHYTTNGDDPSADGATYSVYPPTTPFSKSDQHLIKACAVINDGATPTPNTASSAVITLLNKPNVTLEAGPYIYKGAPWEPEVTSVSIGNESTSSGYTVSYSSEHTNAGNVNITISDVDATDDWYIWNATKTFTITPAALTVIADAKTKEYGDADPALTYTSEGLIGTDAITGNLSRDAGEDVGTYAINQNTLTAGNNYAVTYTPANLTINKKSLGDGTTPAAGIVINIDGNDVVTVTRTSPTSVDLTLDTDFTVSGPTEEEGNQVWTISGIGNYDGGAKVMRIGLTFNETEIATGSNVHDVTPYKASANMTIDGLDAYKVTHVNMTKRIVTIKKINYVKKDEPLLLLTDLAGTELNYVGTATPLYVAEGDVADTSDNLLQVSPEGGKPVAFGEVYMYYQGKFVMTTGGTLAEGKFYLDNPNPPSSSGGGGTSNAPLRIVIDDTTDMEDVKTMMEDEREGPWYTLDGRRLNGKPNGKGLYLKEGKKIVIK